MLLPPTLDHPLIAIADLHGQRAELECLIARLEELAEWPESALMFLGDFIDRGEDTPGTIDLELDLLDRPSGGSAVLGTHDLALVRAARLDDGSSCPNWIESYRTRYVYEATILGYIGRKPNRGGARWEQGLDELGTSIPEIHRSSLVSLP
jgi:serine/threonine protein phosphatase 1